MRSPWNLSTLTLATSDHQSQKSSKSKRNKLRRRRRPSPLRNMPTAPANGMPTPEDDDGASSMPTPMSAAASSSPTLLEKHLSSSPTHRERDSDKDDAQAQVIDSLRTQIGDLITQVSQLNGKLVKSYDRVSDLEDDLHMASSSARTQSLKISELEIERAQHLSALNTGLYVEKAHVTTELTRLMERATAEVRYFALLTLSDCSKFYRRLLAGKLRVLGKPSSMSWMILVRACSTKPTLWLSRHALRVQSASGRWSTRRWPYMEPRRPSPACNCRCKACATSGIELRMRLPVCELSWRRESSWNILRYWLL